MDDFDNFGELVLVPEESNTNVAPDNSPESNDRRGRRVQGTVKEKRPSTLLNRQRLIGPNGLECIERYFKDIKFKGKGHEREDLNNIMHNLEQWVHRLYPKFTFDDTLKRIEKLGSQSQVKARVKRMKLGFDETDTPVENTDNSQQQQVEENDL